MPAGIFYDLENLGIASMGYEAAMEAMGQITTQVKTCPLFEKILVQKAYIAHNNPQANILRNVLKAYDIELVEAKPLDNAPKKPNLVDFKLFGDAMEALCAGDEITALGLASGDNDFGFLCETARRKGRKIVLISRGDALSGALLSLSSDWINVSKTYTKFKPQALWLERVPAAAIPPEPDFQRRIHGMLLRASEDLLLRRFAMEKILNMELFRWILDRYVTLPAYEFLGYKEFSDFAAFLVKDTDFCIVTENSKRLLALRTRVLSKEALVEAAEPLSRTDIFRKSAHIPDGYTAKRGKHWRHFLKKHRGDLAELKQYLNYFERCGIVNYDAITKEARCLPKEKVLSAMEKELKSSLETKHLTASEEEIQEFVRML